MKTRILVSLLVVFHVALSVFHINHTAMWDDEASVVWFAKNYNTYGKIVGYDGANLFSYRNGQLINDQLIYNNPPLDIYFTSYVIKYIGEDDLTVRSSFLIAGLLALLIFISCFRMITGKDNTWYLYGVILLVFSVNYLLIEANSRYYSLNFLFASASIWASLKIAQVPVHKTGWKILFLVIQLVSVYFLFLSHYLAAVCWWGMCFFILVQNRSVKISLKDTFTWIAVLLNGVLFIALASYFVSHQALNRPDMANGDGFILKYVKLFGWLVNDLNRSNIIPIWSIFLLLYLVIFRRNLLSPAFKKLVLFSMVFLGLSYVLNPQSTSLSTCYDMRYIYVIIPFLYLGVAYLLTLLHNKVKYGKFLAPLLTFIYINSTAICFIPESTPVRFLLPAFISERLAPYPTAYSESVNYIQTHFNGRKKILTIPGFHNTVFLRYVPDKIAITNTLDPFSPLSKTVVDSLGQQCLYIGKCKPDYIFLFGNYGELEKYPFTVKDYKYVDTIRVHASGIDYSRPELFWHSFGPKEVKNIDKDALYILHD